MDLTDKQWPRLEPVISQSVRWKDSRSRKPRDLREALNGILWALCAGDMPGRCPAAPDLPQTVPALDKVRNIYAHY